MSLILPMFPILPPAAPVRTTHYGPRAKNRNSNLPNPCPPNHLRSRHPPVRAHKRGPGPLYRDSSRRRFRAMREPVLSFATSPSIIAFRCASAPGYLQEAPPFPATPPASHAPPRPPPTLHARLYSPPPTSSSPPLACMSAHTRPYRPASHHKGTTHDPTLSQKPPFPTQKPNETTSCPTINQK